MKKIQSTQTATVITIGNFDGLHKGHLKLIRKVKEIAEKYSYKSLVCTFDCNTKNAKLIFPQTQLSSALCELNIDFFTKLNFHEEIKGLSCEEFVTEFICKRFHAKVVVVGDNFRFGNQQSGTVDTLKALGKQYDFKVFAVKAKLVGKKILSSTYLRDLLQNGKIAEANRYLYEPFSVYGKVKNGFHLGKNVLCFPTANISLPKNSVMLPHGVYATKLTVDNQTYNSITNIGIAPTKPKSKPVIETHILDFSGDIYQKRIKVTFLKYIRHERKFSSLEALKKQIEKDIKNCKALFDSN